MALERTGVPFTEERKENIRIAALLRDKPNDDTRNKMSISQKERFKNESPQQKATRILKMSLSQKGVPKIRASCIFCRLESSVVNIKRYHGDKCSKNPILGNENKAERKANAINKQVTCPHCGLKGSPTTLKRSHFDRCLEHPEKGKMNRLQRVNKDGRLSCPHCKAKLKPDKIEKFHLKNCPKHP